MAQINPDHLFLSPKWIEDSKRETGRVLTGKYGHWCPDWDYLTIDETCPEWPCPCDPEVILYAMGRL